MSFLELIVVLIGGSVIAVQLYAAYRFWQEDREQAAKPANQEKRAKTTKPVPSPANRPSRAAA